MKAGGGLEEMDQLGDQFQPFFADEILNSVKLCFENNFTIARFENNFGVVTRFNTAIGPQRRCKVNCGRAGMK